MNLEDYKTQELVKKYNFKFSKSLGQNFLTDESVLNDIVSGAEVNNEDMVIEIGPGVGTLTAKLLSKAKKVISIELDNDLIPILEQELGDNPNVAISQKAVKDEVEKIDNKISYAKECINFFETKIILIQDKIDHSLWKKIKERNPQYQKFSYSKEYKKIEKEYKKLVDSYQQEVSPEKEKIIKLYQQILENE